MKEITYRCDKCFSKISKSKIRGCFCVLRSDNFWSGEELQWIFCKSCLKIIRNYLLSPEVKP